VFGNAVPVVTGGVLVALGAIGLVRRMLWPSAQRDLPSDTSRMPLDVALPDAGTLAPLEWRSSYESGHPVIDAQHRGLFVIGDELVQAAQQRRPREQIELMLDDMVEHIKSHFATEEAVLARTRYPLSREHRQMHDELLQRAQSLRDRYRADQLDVRELVSFVAHDVVAQHIVQEDLRFALQSASA
jgi:hemerythrin-like metal-binding protein